MNLVLNKNNKINTLQITDEVNYFRKLEKRITIDPITGKESGLKLHKVLLEGLRDEFDEEINEQIILPVEYKDKKGENRVMFELTTEQAKQLMSRESKTIRKLVVRRLTALEETLKGNFNVPTTMLEAMQLATKTLEANEQLQTEKLQLETKVQEDAPKVEFAEEVETSVNSIDMRDFDSRTFKLGRNTMFAKLRGLKILDKNNKPYSKYIQMNIFEIKTSTYKKPSGNNVSTQQTLITGKGQVYLVSLLKKKLIS